MKYDKKDVWEIQYDTQLAANLISARQRKNYTQEGLAEKMKTSQSAIARAENGNVPPGHAFLKRIARGLGMKLLPPTLVEGSTTDAQHVLDLIKNGKIRDFLIKQTYKEDFNFKELNGYITAKDGDTILILSIRK